MTSKQRELEFASRDGGSVDIYIDGAARGNPGQSGIGVLIKQGSDSFEIRKYLGERTNNQAEYTALITALEAADTLRELTVNIYTDSLLVANQVNGVWKVKHPDIAKLNKTARELMGKYKNARITHIPREQNREADRLANLAIDEYL